MTPPAGRLTPFRRQYLLLKRQYPDYILFFRLGDFYETFDQDAETAARELEITLTSRSVAKGQRVPMAGVPYHAAESYIARLIARGHRVAVCEQLGSQAQNGLMPRDVVRIVTPGTVTEPHLLEERRNNYLAAYCADGERGGLAYADLSTGEFRTTELTGHLEEALLEELSRLQPAELLLAEDAPTALSEDTSLLLGRPPVVTALPAWRFEAGQAAQVLLEHFEVASLEPFGCAGMPLAVRAAGALLQYLEETQRAGLPNLAHLSTYHRGSFMTLDAATRRNLELNEALRSGQRRGSLLGVLDETLTPMGARALRGWLNQPLLDVEALNERLDAVEVFFEDEALRAEVRAALKGLGDLERLTNRVLQYRAGPRELVALAASLERLPRLRELVEDRPLPAPPPLDPPARLIRQALLDDPPPALGEQRSIRRGFSAELDGLVESIRGAREWISSLEAKERGRTGIKSLKVGFNKVFGYYLEVTKANARLVPDDYHRKQTLVGAERYITPELKDYEAQILSAEERIQAVEAAVFAQVVEQVAAAGSRLLEGARTVARLDVLAALAEVARHRDYTRPVLADAPTLHLREGRHPVVEALRREERFVPNDVLLDAADHQILLITGPNAAGKSTYLRQVALITLMAQIGSFVPAREAHVGLADRIFTRIGAQDEIAAGQSTFMVEMIETAHILNHASDRSLIVLDEIGRGTSTYDGISIAWAVVEHLHNHPSLRARTLFATHYHELTVLASLLPRVQNYNVAVIEEGGRVVFLRRIVPGGADRSYGIHVAELAGLPRAVIHRAREILHDLESRDHAGPVSSKATAQQLALFDPPPHPVLEELRRLELDGLTPLEALNLLYRWRHHGS